LFTATTSIDIFIFLTKALPTSKHNACITALHLGQ
jgi:hypothetical protein